MIIRSKRYIAIILMLLFCINVFAGCDLLETPTSSNTTSGNGSGLYINEVVSSNAYSLVDPDLGTPDWIELYNASSSSIALNGYELSDKINNPDKWKFPDITIKPGEYLLLYAASQINGDTDNSKLCTGFKVSSSGETIVLTDPKGNAVQELQVPALLADVSWGRGPDGNYYYFGQPTPGAENGKDGVDSPDKIIQSVAAGTIRINEVMVDNRSYLPDSDGAHFAWAEIYNTSKETVSLRGYYLSDSASNSTKWQFPDVSLEPGKCQIIYLSGKDKVDPKGELHANFKLSKEEKGLWLISPNGVLIDRVQWQDVPPNDFSLGRDSQGNLKYYGVPTPGEPNGDNGLDTLQYGTIDPANGVRINEFLVENKYSKMDADGDRDAWVEIYNASKQSINLKNYVLSDDKGDPTKWRFPDTSIEAGSYMLVFLSGKNKNQAGQELHTGFKLSKNDSVIMLTNLEAMQCDTESLPQTILDNVSYGRSTQDPSKWLYYAQPTPAQKNTTKGYEDITNVAAVDKDGLWISEVSSVAKAKSKKLDWIEIANGGGKAINLAGYYLSDDIDNPTKWKIPSISIAAGGYTVIYTSSKKTEQKATVATFGINPSGEDLVLSSPDGNVLDVFASGALRTNLTSGRANGDYSGKRVFFVSETPGKANDSNEVSTYAAQPVFSQPGGYASGAVQLSITCDTQGAQIYYTLDGSKPTTSSKPYADPITITSTTVVKAIASGNNLLSSDMTVSTYIFDQKHTVPVISLSGNADDISAVYAVTDRNVKLEREAYVEYYEDDGSLGVEFPAGIRVAGASTRTAAQKSLNVYLRGGYGQSSVTYPFFKDFKYITFKSIELRDSGQDRVNARIRDAYAAMASRDMNVDYAEYRLVAVYINGKYWGLYDLRENQNEDYYAYRFNTAKDNVERIRRNQTALSGTSSEILAVRAYARTKNMQDDAVFAEFCKKVDADAFMDYIIAETFFCNADMFNQKFTRAIDYSFKWRPDLFDFDLAMQSSSRNLLGSFFNPLGVPSADGSLTNMDIQCALLRNPGWREKFIERYAYILNNIYTKDKLLTLLEKMAAEMEPEMQRYIDRWKPQAPASVSAWKSNIQDVRDFLSVRTQVMKQQLKSFFNLSDAKMKELFPNG